MKKYWKYIFIGAFLMVLGAFNYQIFHKEETLKNGDLIFLELAPKDPRSLMQGDYMVLRYKIASMEWDSLSKYENLPSRGFLVVSVNDKKIGEGKRFQQSTYGLKPNEYALKYFKKEFSFNIGAESYFFQEGKGYALDSARYGGLRVDKQGNSLLIGLYDRNLKLIDLEKVKVLEKNIRTNESVEEPIQ
ncbi:MAG: GDYXXLXY domain-containing protein [Raineya sp.]|jgi:uncharacterized membrane-anchored protein|nr:GDYXXLXY domain-containing protein [Raineya sp.]